jgi:protein Tex
VRFWSAKNGPLRFLSECAPKTVFSLHKSKAHLMSTTTAHATLSQRILTQLSAEVAAPARDVNAAVQLLDEGATVPFISRYRKEVTGGLTDTQLRLLEERLAYLRELEDRRAAILKSVEELGKLTPELFSQLDQADTKQRLEDLYAPYKPKRRTKAQTAREAGLEPLALGLLNDPTLDPTTEAGKYLNPTANIETTAQALEGARDILAEDFAQQADLLAGLRAYIWDTGVLQSAANTEAGTPDEKFRDYFEFAETIRTVPSHRALALLRGREVGSLTIKLVIEHEEGTAHPCEGRIANFNNIKNMNRAADKWLQDLCRYTWRIKLSWSLESDALMRLREQGQAEAIKIFAMNLKDLLLAAPAGPKIVMGLDPGIRTGVKLAVVDGTGKLLATDTIYPHEPRKDWDGSINRIAQHCALHKVNLIAIGNGTASRETDKLVLDFFTQFKLSHIKKIVVSEAGASVYSASELASKEFPDLDVSIRGAVSIARRLQDPLAELVKIDPKAIGVGQYQHDVDQRQLAQSLDKVVEDCVNSVGVDVNTASPALLARVSGLNSILAENVVAWREKNGAFANRAALLKVPRLGEKTYQQAAGFLRVNDGDNPLDRSAVHPESYPLVERILDRLKKPLPEVMGQSSVVKSFKPESVVDAVYGLPTVVDVLLELEKPGRDPRPEFVTASFKEGVEELRDLRPDMILEGVVTNVTAFGAFVDIGVHQDGLVHISALSTKFVSDPHTVVKAGEVVKVKVLEIDLARKRVALTMRLTDAAPKPRETASNTVGQRSSQKSASFGAGNGGGNRSNQGGGGQNAGSGKAVLGNSAMAEAFAKLKK